MRPVRPPLALLCALAGCAYDPPPEVTMDIPPGGAFLVGDPLTARATRVRDC